MVPRRFPALALAALCAFVVTALFRYLALAGFPNDQFEHLAGAQQMLFGEWPTKDFVDPGMPLTYAASAAAQWLLGRTLLAEAVLNACAFAVAAACTLVAAHRLSRSLVIAVIATVLSVAIFPRPYAYPKLLVTAVGPLIIWAWMSAPTMRRLITLGVAVVVAFLFRHDYGVHLGIAACAGILLAQADGRRQTAVRLTTFCAIVALLLAPYALYLQAYGGFVNAVGSVLEYGQRHAQRTQLHLAALAWNDETALFYGFHALPVVALGCLLADWRGRVRSDVRTVLPLVVFAISINVGFLRDPLSSRLADAVVPAALVGAWLAGRAWRMSGAGRRAVAMAVVAAVAVAGADAVFAVGRTADQWDRTGLGLGRGFRQLPRRLKNQTGELTIWDSRRQSPDALVTTLFPFFEYLDRCTTTRQRLLVAGYAPDVYVYAHRPFAGGQKVFMQGYYHSATDQALIIERMTRQVVPFVLLLTDQLSEWQTDFPQVNAFVESRFQPMADIPVRGDRTVRVLVDAHLPPLRTDTATGWPCYR